jgi:xanthine dehydrogenase accessory factor
VINYALVVDSGDSRAPGVKAVGPIEYGPARRSAATALQWLSEDRPVALGLLAVVEGSAPMDAGAMLFVDGTGRVEGSITGGCVESDVAQRAQALLEEGGAPFLQRYGISDELAGTAGLMCGGIVHVLVQRADPRDAALVRYLEAVVAGRCAGAATLLDGPNAGRRIVVDGDEVLGGLGGDALLDHNVASDVRAAIDQDRSVLRRYGTDGARLEADLRVRISAHGEPARMIVVGAIDFSAALAPMAAALGFAVTICDPRSAFLASSRFSAVAQTVVRWPDEFLRERPPGPRDAVLVFSHDPKLDVPAVVAALQSDAGYVGALGSRRTTREREARLREAGVSDEALARLHAPCGLDVGAASPEETAVAVLSEILAARSGRGGGALSAGDGAIRARDEVDAATAAPPR